jgi:hypothetical protein
MDKIFPNNKKSRKQHKVLASKLLRRKCHNGLQSLDLFGEQVNMTYNGRDTFTTLPGSLASLIILMIVLAFTGYRLDILVSRKHPNVTEQILMKDLNLEEPYRPQEDGFDFAFGLGAPLDPTYGTF